MLSHLVEFGIYPSANVNNLESIRFGIRPVRPSLYVFVQTVYFAFHVNQTMYASTCNGATFRKTDHNPQHVSATFCDSWHFLISRFPLVKISYNYKNELRCFLVQWFSYKNIYAISL